mmetsp:Transcript_2315/g.4290  ORF Transcript_2315/g.4290 Transcript_2315/m.4290 type:complete len:113 (+) Transcript_2315:1027-1365(+)
MLHVFHNSFVTTSCFFFARCRRHQNGLEGSETFLHKPERDAISFSNLNVRVHCTTISFKLSKIKLKQNFALFENFCLHMIELSPKSILEKKLFQLSSFNKLLHTSVMELNLL